MGQVDSVVGKSRKIPRTVEAQIHCRVEIDRICTGTAQTHRGTKLEVPHTHGKFPSKSIQTLSDSEYRTPTPGIPGRQSQDSPPVSLVTDTPTLRQAVAPTDRGVTKRTTGR